MDVVGQRRRKYRGSVDLGVLGVSDRGWIVDAVQFGAEMGRLKQLIEDVKVVKFSYRLRGTLAEVKREWQAFGVNFYDF